MRDRVRLVQLARDNGIAAPAAWRYLHEGPTALAGLAPDLATALEHAAAAGCTDLNLDGAVIHTDRVAAAKGHRGPGLLAAVGVADPRDREHNTTCARAQGLIRPLNRLPASLGIPALTDLGYENIGNGFRHPVKKPKSGELTEPDRTFNAVIRGVHGMRSVRTPC